MNMVADDKDKRPDHSVETDKDRRDIASGKHEVDAPSSGRVDDEADDKTTTRQE